MRVEVGRGGAGRGERAPCLFSLLCNPVTRPGFTDHPLLTPQALSSLFAWKELFIFAMTSFYSVRVSSGLWELSRPWSLPRFGLAVSWGIKKRRQVQTQFLLMSGNGKAWAEKEYLLTY